MHFLQHAQVHRFHCGHGRRHVAGIQPDEDAGMAPQPQDLVVLRFFRDEAVFVIPFVPLLEVVAAAPAGHHQHADLVGELEELRCLKRALEPDGVQSHVLRQQNFIAQVLRIDPHHGVIRPTAAADQDRFSVDAEEQAALGFVQLTGDLADAKTDLRFIGDLAAGFELQLEVVQHRLAHLRGPPKFGVLHH